MRLPRLNLLHTAPLLMLLVASTAEVDAASAVGRASATVVNANFITPVNISVARPSIISGQPSVATSQGPAIASVIAGGEGLSNVVRIAGVAVSSVDGGSALSFSVAGDTTSAYVVQLASPQSGSAPGDSLELLGTGSPSLILAAQPLMGSGRLAIVFSQAPSDLVPGAISLSVNYN
ncbi:hypothetical protein [Lacisediminimonas profundi]|uniref:hypothetical protein n=1 Tax=Lacisediminimonas profundi TaxID=2603856 RepID=UPI00124B1A46|nr:hypothetical protein [Lacisediminimonas profundi]